MSLFTGGMQGSSPEWRRSRFCTNSGCLEVSFSGTVSITDSKQLTDRVVLKVNTEIWNEFCRRVALTGDSVTIDGLSASVANDGSTTLTDGVNTLSYTNEEWDAFVKSVSVGELMSPETAHSLA